MFRLKISFCTAVFILLFLLVPVVPYAQVEAVTWYASHNGSGSACTSGSPCSLGTANTKPVAGDTVILKNSGGVYTTSINPSNSGIAGNPIMFRGESSAVTVRNATLAGKAYITIDNLKFQSIQGGFISSNVATNNITIINSTFDSIDNGFVPSNYSYVGISILGDYFVLRNNTFLKWYGGDQIRVNGDYTLIENNDFSKADSGHGNILGFGSNLVVRNNYFRNRWDRAWEGVSKNGDPAPNKLFENNIVFDSNWDTVYPYPASATDGGGTSESGATQLAKIGGSISIVRNNLTVSSNEGKQGSNFAYKAVWEITPYDTAYWWEHLRIYHNTLTDNMYDHGIFLSRNAPEWYMDDNVFKNNIIDAPAGKYSIHANNSSVPLMTYTFQNNILTRPINRWGTVYQTAADFNNVSLSDAISGNISILPTFLNSGISVTAQTDGTDNTRISMQDFSLSAGSAGKNAAAHLTTVMTNGTNTTNLTVDDAYYFYDGYDIPGEEGDLIIITNASGGNARQTQVADVVSKTSMTVSPAVTVVTGDRVYLATYGTTPDIGIVTAASQPDPTPTTGVDSVVLTVTPASCLSGPTTSDTDADNNALYISWVNPTGGPAVDLVQIGQSSSFTPSSYRITGLTAATTSVQAPDGFTEYSGSTNTGNPVTLQPDTTYYVRAWNGTYTPTQIVVIPLCVVKPGDVNGDGRVTIADLATLLANFGMSAVTRDKGDLTGDGKVSIADLAELLAHFGESES